MNVLLKFIIVADIKEQVFSYATIHANVMGATKAQHLITFNLFLLFRQGCLFK